MISNIKNLPAIGAMEQNQPLFDKIILKPKKSLPENLDLTGCFVFTRDSKHTGWLHRLIFFIQRLVACLFRKKPSFDYNLSHGFLTLEKDVRKKDHFIIAHSVLGKEANIRTASRNYLLENDITELVVYRPRNQNLRELITKYGYQTSYTDPKFVAEEAKKMAMQKGKGKFSIAKMLVCLFVPQKIQDKADKRIACLAADLLLGQQFKTLDGKKQKAMYCAPYALSVVQGSLLIDSMSREEREKLINLKSRAKIVQAIFKKIQQKSEQENIAKTYWNNSILRIKSNYAMSAHINEVFETQSEELRVIQPEI